MASIEKHRKRFYEQYCVGNKKVVKSLETSTLTPWQADAYAVEKIEPRRRAVEALWTCLL